MIKKAYKKGMNPNSRNGFKKGYLQSNTGRTHFKKGSSGFMGGHHSKETKKKLSEARKGRKLSIEIRKKMSEVHKERYKDKNERLKTSLAAPRGEKSNFWKGGITPINMKIRSSIEYRLWREAVFVRDNWTCQKCGLRSEKGEPVYLQAHHIKNFAQYPELRTSIENGITFCKKCHKRFHKIYGRENNTAEQLNEFALDYYDNLKSNENNTEGTSEGSSITRGENRSE